MIQKLLIANRGEIARRIFRTAHEMGIATVAIYADGDANSPFVQEADTAIALQGQTSAETYLDAEKVYAACVASGADAVHPGYGFLSENARFAEAITKRGITWVGPPTHAIEEMGDKLSAKQAMTDAGVPTLPAHELNAGDDLAKAADAIGFPVLVKASAGGGGRGSTCRACTGGPRAARPRASAGTARRASALALTLLAAGRSSEMTTTSSSDEGSVSVARDGKVVRSIPAATRIASFLIVRMASIIGGLAGRGNHAGSPAGYRLDARLMTALTK